MAVVGGGDSACEEATYLAGLCNKVYMIVRRDVFRASKAMQERVFATPNIEILWNCNTQEVLGDDTGVTGVRLVRKNGEVFDIKVDGFFLGIGHHPNAELFAPWVQTDENGYIVTEGKTTWKGFSQRETCRIRNTARPLRRRRPDAGRPWMPNVSCWKKRINKRRAI